MATYKTELDYIKANADFVIHALDVGGGDSILIQTKGGKENYLIDTGGGSEKSETLLWNALQNYKVETLDKVIITHPHVDHDGNLPFLIKKEKEIAANKASLEAAGKTYEGPKFSITQVYTNGIHISLSSSRQYQYEDYFTGLGRYSSLNTDSDPLTLDGSGSNSTTWTVLWPSKDFIGEMQERTNKHVAKYGNIADKADEGAAAESEFLQENSETYSINNSSIVGKLVRGNFSMLFTGDTGAKIWSNWIDQSKLQSTVYKAAHHSQSSANVGTVCKNKVKPYIVIITGGDHQNPYPHPGLQTWNKFVPRIATVHRFYNCNVPIPRMWCTRQHGDIHIAFFGDEFTVYPSNQDYMWGQTWTNLMNRSIDLTDPTRGIYYECDGTSLVTVRP